MTKRIIEFFDGQVSPNPPAFVAADTAYDPNTSSTPLVATDMQDAIDELDANAVADRTDIASNTSDLTSLQVDFSSHIHDGVLAPKVNAQNVEINNSGNSLTALDVENSFDELDAKVIGPITVHSDVDYPVAPVLDEVLKYDGANWIPGSVPLGATPIDALSDVDTTTTPPLLNEVLKWDGVNWTPNPVGGVSSIDDLTDVDTTSTLPVVGDRLQWDGANWVPLAMPVFGTEFQFVEDQSVSTTTGILFTNKLTLVTPALPAGNYRMTFSYQWNYDATNSDFEARGVLNGATAFNDRLFNHRQEPKDNGGTGPGDTVGTGTDQNHSHTFTIIKNFTGVQTIELDWRSTNLGTNSSIWHSTLELWRVS